MADVTGLLFFFLNKIDSSPKILAGSPYWIPPEMIKGHNYGLAADIWSFGICVLEFFIQDPPFKQEPFKYLHKALTDGFSELYPKDMSQKARNFLSHTFQIQPKYRWTAKELIKVCFTPNS